MSEEKRSNKISNDYGAEQIQVLEGVEPVRKRPGMYIGSTGPRGLHHLVLEVVDNSVDEALAGHCDHIEIVLRADGSALISDNGRGIPTDIHPRTGKSALETVLTVLHAGGKFGSGGYKVSGGLHGVGISVVNALSEWVNVTVYRDGSEFNQRFEKGISKGELETKAWLSGMISNVSQPFFPGDISIIRAVSKKKCGVGIVNHYYVARMLAGVNGRRDALYAKKTKVLTPNPAHVNISAGGVAKYATNKKEAVQLLEFLASPEGSKGLAAPTFEHPLKEVNQNQIVQNFGEFIPDSVTVEELGEKNSLAIQLMKDAGWN